MPIKKSGWLIAAQPGIALVTCLLALLTIAFPHLFSVAWSRVAQLVLLVNMGLQLGPAWRAGELKLTVGQIYERARQGQLNDQGQQASNRLLMLLSTVLANVALFMLSK